MKRSYRLSRVSATAGLFVGVVSILVASGSARATTIDFTIEAPTAGSVTYAPSISPRLFGVGIEVDGVLGTDTPLNGGTTFDCIDCRLDFVTGNFLFATADSWVFAGGGSVISVVGGVDTDGDGDADIVGVGANPLLAGVFTTPQVSVDFLPGPLSIGFTAAAFFDIKNRELASFFGLPPFPYEGALTLGWTGFADPPGAILATPTSGLVSNRFVPEPATTLVFIVGLLGVARMQSRRRLE